MISISIEEFVNIYCKNNPGKESNQLREHLQQAVKDKKNGGTCINCGQEIWAIGSALANQGLKHACNEDDNLFERYMDRILLSLADNYGFEGWYDVYTDLESTYNTQEDTDEYTVASKLKVLKAVIHQIEEKQHLTK